MSMLELITNMQEGFRLPGLFSGEKDGAKTKFPSLSVTVRKSS